MKLGEERFEEWLEEQAVAFLGESRAGRRRRPEEFARSLPALAADPERRARLVSHLRRIEEVEEVFAREGLVDLAPGAELDDFVLEGRLGQGGMGQVFRAWQKSLDRAVAIKVPLWPGLADARERERFRREAEAVARLRHPAIVTLLQVGEARGMPYLVLELAEGVPLSELLKRLGTGELPRSAASLGQEESSYERAVARLALAVLGGLEAAHAEGVVHRDLKPSNLMLGPGGRVRILDFGLARRAEQESLTGSSELVGTPEYLAPELVRNPRAASPASDVYACGVLVYELLAFERPFRAPSTELLLARILQGDPLPLHARRRAPRALSAIVEKAMARDPGRRYASAASCAAELAAFLEGREVGAKPSGPLGRLGRKLQRRPAVTGGVALALAAMAVLGSLWQSSSAREALARERATALQGHRDAEQARRLFVDASLDELLDTAMNGGPRTRREGGRRALEKLGETVRLDPTFLEARLHRAVVALELGSRDVAASELALLLGAGWSDRAVEWLQACLEDQSSTSFGPPPMATIEAGAASAVERFYAARAYQRLRETQARAALLARSLRTDPLYAAPALVIEAVSLTVRGVGDHPSAVRLYSQASALAPDHPIIAVNLAQAIGTLWLAKTPMIDPAVIHPPLELLDALATLEQSREKGRDIDVYWGNYAYILGCLSSYDPAYRRRIIDEIRPVLDRFPEHQGLTNNWLGAVLHEIVDGGTLALDLLTEGRARLARLLEASPSEPKYLMYAAAFHGATGDLEQAHEHLAVVAERLKLLAQQRGRRPDWAPTFDAVERWLGER